MRKTIMLGRVGRRGRVMGRVATATERTTMYKMQNVCVWCKCLSAHVPVPGSKTEWGPQNKCSSIQAGSTQQGRYCFKKVILSC